MKIWEKIYAIVLVLFILVLNICNARIFQSIYMENVQTVEEAAVSRWESVAVPLSEDLLVMEGDVGAEGNLFENYVSYFSSQNVAFELWQGEILCYKSSIGTQVTYSCEQGELSSDFGIQQGEIWEESGMDGEYVRAVILKREQGKFVCVMGRLPGTMDTLAVYEDVSERLSVWKTHVLHFIGVELAASMLIAVLLYGVMRRFLQPMDLISQMVAGVAEGNYTYHLEVRGNDEMATLAQDISAMAEQIREYVEHKEREAGLKQEFIDAMSHELRTPLTSIHGYAQLLRAAHVPEKKKTEYVEHIVRESGRMAEMFHVLREITLLQRDGVEREDVSVYTLMTGIQQAAGMEREREGVLFSFEPKGGTLYCHRILTEMFFVNLIRNACQACAAARGNGREERQVAVEMSEKTAVVRDTGTGMSEECKKRIFEPFYREDRSRSRRQGGTGLGMYLCKKIADLHGWRIEIVSEQGKGTEIFVHFES